MGFWSNLGGSALLSSIPLVGDLVNANQADKAALAQRNFEREMWRANNEYNLPINQRARLEAAGLNPAMMYGHGTVANTSTQARTPSYTPPRMQGFDRAMSQYQDMRQFDLQKEQMAKQMEAMDAEIRNKDSEIALRAVQAGVAASSAARNQFEVKRGEALLQGSVDYQNEQIRNLGLSSTEKEISNQTLNARQEMILKEAEERIKSMLKTRSLQDIEKQIKQYEVELNRAGVTKSDSVINRRLAPILEPVIDAIKSPSETWKKIKEDAKGLRTNPYQYHQRIKKFLFD